MGKGFMGSEYVWNEGKYRHYYSIRGSKVYHYPFEYDKKVKRYFPYGPGQSVMKLTSFKKLLMVRPGIKKIK